MLMQAVLSATNVRKDWSRFIDTVVHGRPLAVQRNRDILLAVSLPQALELLRDRRFTLRYEFESDGSISGSLEEIDLVGNASDLSALKRDLAQQLIDYSQTYIDRFELYFNAPNRRRHFPYVLHVLLLEAIEDVEALIDA